MGRGEESDLRLEDIKVSRLHAELRVSSDSLEVVDLGSTNGTFVNRKPIPAHANQSLQAGDEIHFGKTRFVCQR